MATRIGRETPTLSFLRRPNARDSTTLPRHSRSNAHPRRVSTSLQHHHDRVCIPVGRSGITAGRMRPACHGDGYEAGGGGRYAGRSISGTISPSRMKRRGLMPNAWRKVARMSGGEMARRPSPNMRVASGSIWLASALPML